MEKSHLQKGITLIFMRKMTLKLVVLYLWKKLEVLEGKCVLESKVSSSFVW